MGQSIVALRQLADAPSLFALVVARGVSSVGDWLYLAALPILLYQATGDVALVGLISAGRLLPWLLLSIPAGIVVDRLPTRTVLLATEIVRAGLMLVMGILALTDAPIGTILVGAVGAAVASTFAMPAFGRFVPQVARDDEQLGRANVVGGGLDSIACILGPGIAAVMIAAGGLELAFLLNGLSFLAIVVVLARIRVPSRVVESQKGVVEAAHPAPAWSTLVPAILRPLAIDAAVSFMAGLLMVLPVLTIASIGADEAFGGVLSLAAGIGGVAGVVAAASFVNGRLRRGLSVALVAGIGGLAVAAVGASALAIVIGAALAAGAVVALDTLNITQVQRTLDGRVLGRGLGLINTSAAVWVIAGSLVPTLLVGTLGLSVVVIGSAAVAAMLGGLGLVRVPRPAPRVERPDAVPSPA